MPIYAAAAAGDLCPLFSNLALGLFRAQFLVDGIWKEGEMFPPKSVLMNDFDLDGFELERSKKGQSPEDSAPHCIFNAMIISKWCKFFT